MMTVPRAFVVALVIAAAGGGYAALHDAQVPQRVADPPGWVEIGWPFAVDQWGAGRAFRCRAAACGTEIELYLRAKIGACNCTSAIDDEEVDRVADFDFVGGAPAALGPGLSIVVNGMEGRSRRYAFDGHGSRSRSVLAIALHDRCDMVVATAAFSKDEAPARAAAVLDFLNSDDVRRWAETTLGL